MPERMRRVDESIRQVLSEALPELKDPRIGFVTVTGVAHRPPISATQRSTSACSAPRASASDRSTG